jgi:hypothetical protein
MADLSTGFFVTAGPKNDLLACAPRRGTIFSAPVANFENAVIFRPIL